MACSIIHMKESTIDKKNVVSERQTPLSRTLFGRRIKLMCMLQKPDMRCGLDFRKGSSGFSKTVELLAQM